MKAWLLGSGGGTSTGRRLTCSALVREGSRGLLIDAGTGVARLLQAPALHQGIEQLDVVLTHFHLDHIVGLPYLPALGLPSPPIVYGPGAALYGKSTKEILAAILTRPLLATDPKTIASDFREISEKELHLGPFMVRGRPQRLHSDPTLALRVNDFLTYCTDTSYDVGNGAFAHGCEILIHEAWYTTGTTHDIANHSSGAQAATVARDAGVDRLVLIHINPAVDEAELERDAKSIFAHIAVGTDLMPLAS
jgi:ribonuclease BN (tRNA processing enzyme)